MFKNPGIGNMADEFAPEPGPGSMQSENPGQPGQDEGIDPGEALEFFLIRARDDKKAAQVMSEFIQAVGEERFNQLLEGGQWSPEEIDLLQQVAMAIAPGGPEEAQNNEMQGQAPMPQPEPGMY
jgi:hypothetical protein